MNGLPANSCLVLGVEADFQGWTVGQIRSAFYRAMQDPQLRSLSGYDLEAANKN